MGKDGSWKTYFHDNRRYADLINGIGCGGEQIVKETDLQEEDVTAKEKNLENGEYLYGFQKDSKLHPLATFILYAGKEPWEKPNSLNDMLDFTDVPDKLRGIISDYKINVIDTRKFENTDVFQTDVKQVFDFIRYSEDRNKLLELVENDTYYKEMDEDGFDDG